MKKFFGIGLLALLTTAYLTSSCSRDEFSGSLLEAKAEAFNNAFKEIYGDPDPQHTWGFGDDTSTRAFTRGAAPNANEWAESWLVPDPLTAGQKERVTRYFQSHPNLTYQDPGWSNYFIQQVYKGGGNDRNNSQWCTSEKDEWYTSANNGSVIGSDHMDHLIAKSVTGATDHIYNFNNGTCTPNPDILNNGHTVNEWADNHHSDEIQLMTNSYTHTFTYGSSDASMVRERRCALVSAAEIDRWATEEANGIGATVNDKWGRSFMGFDFEQRICDEIFAKDENSADGFRYATVGDGPMSKNFYWNGTQVLPLTDEVKNTALGVRMLVNESNMYCGINGDIDGNDLYSKHLVPIEVDGQTRYQEDDCLDLTLVYQRISDGYYPIEGSNLTKWVIPQGGADGYYSDWIVTLSKAQPKNGGDTPSEGADLIPVQRIVDGRIFCEDLGSADRTDIDFNDVVFDAFTYMTDTYEVPYTLNNGNKVYIWNNRVYKYSTYNKTDINLLAAGGTIDIQVAGQDVNSLLGIEKTTMANTYVLNASPDLSGAHVSDRIQPYKYTLNNDSYKDLREISIAVKSGNQVRELSANVGDVPQKFRAPVGTPWLVERKAIDYGYEYFRNWVGSEPKNNDLWHYMTYGNLYHVKFISNIHVSNWGGTIGKFWGNMDLDYPAMYVDWENQITITLSEALETGDQIAVTGYRMEDDNKAGTLYIKCGGQTVAQTQDYNNILFDYSKPNTFVFSVPSNLAGNSGFQLSKDPDGAQIYITGITVIGGSVMGTDLNIDPTTLTPNSSLTLPAASFNNVSAATVYIYGTGNGEVLVNGVSATTESSAPRFGFTRSATPVVKVCQLGPSNLKTNRVVVSGYNFRVVKCSMVNQTGNYSVSEPTGKGDIIYNTSTILDWGDNGGAVTITNDALKSVQVGSKIRVFGIGYASSYWEVQAFGFNTTGGWNQSTQLSPQDGTSFSGNGAKEIVFPITTQAQANMVKGGRIVVQGYNFILKYVTVDNPSSGGGTYTTVPVWSGENRDENWTTIYSGKGDKFNNAKSGDILRITAHPKDATQWWQFNLANGNYGDVNDYIKDSTDGQTISTSGYQDIVLTQTAINNLKAGGLMSYKNNLVFTAVDLLQKNN